MFPGARDLPVCSPRERACRRVFGAQRIAGYRVPMTNGIGEAGHPLLGAIGDDSPAARRPGEADEDYAWFLDFLAQSRPRTTAAVARQHGKRESTIRKRAARWDWGARAAAWDHEQRAHVADQVSAAVDDVAVNLAESLRAHAQNVQRAVLNADPADIPTRDLASNLRQLGATSADLEALAAETRRSADIAAPALRQVAERDPEGAARRTLADFAVNPAARPADRIGAARSVLGLPEPPDDTAAAVDAHVEISRRLVGGLTDALADVTPETRSAVLAAVAEALQSEDGTHAQ